MTAIYLDRASNRWRVVTRDGSTAYWYRVVMADHLGRQLLPTEHIHHRNGDTTDDRIENLELLDIREHGSLHQPEAAAARAANRRFAWSRDYSRCEDCGTDERRYFASGLCQRCYHRNYMRRRRAEGMAA